MAVFHFLCFLFVRVLVVDDKLIVMFRLQDILNLIHLFVQKCFNLFSFSFVIDMDSFLEKLMAGSILSISIVCLAHDTQKPNKVLTNPRIARKND